MTIFFLFRRLPFNSKTLIGYFGYIFIQIPTTLVAAEQFFCVWFSNCAFCLLSTAFALDLKTSLCQLNEDLQKDDSKMLASTKSFKMKMGILSFIQFQSEARK